MIIVLYVLGVLLLILVAILFIPLRFELQANNQPALSIIAKLKWAFGMVGFKAAYGSEGLSTQAFFFGLSRPLNSDKNRPQTDSAAEKPEHKRGRGSLLNYLNRSMLASITLLLRRLIKALRLDVNLSGRYGFEEPDVTAMAALISGFLNSSAVNLQPDYSRAILDIRGYVRGRIILAQLLLIAARFLFSKPVKAIWWPKIKTRRKGKEIIQYA